MRGIRKIESRMRELARTDVYNEGWGLAVAETIRCSWSILSAFTFSKT